MNLYLEPQGFLGTGASLLADLTLLAYILLIVPAMAAGFYFARNGKHRPHHQVVMNGVTVVNWVLIAFLMIAAYRFDVIGNIGQEPGNLRYLLPTIHGVMGLVAQVLGTWIMFRMWKEDRDVAAAKKRGERNLRPYWWTRAKPVMQITLGLWFATSALGIGNYLIRYNVIPPFATDSTALPEGTEEPESTPDVAATAEVEMTPEATPMETPEVEATQEVMAITPEVAATEDVDAAATLAAQGVGSTPEVVDTPEVMETPEVMATPEVEDDDSGQGRGRGRGRGGDDDEEDDND